MESAALSSSHVLTIRGQAICLQEDWSSGIGGGLWSTGVAMGHYFGTRHFMEQSSLMTQAGPDRPFRVLELGSGNGFLSVCLAVALTSQPQQQEQRKHPRAIEIVATDTADHLDLMRSTVDKNLGLMGNLIDKNGEPLSSISVREYLWGSKDGGKFVDLDDNGGSTDNKAGPNGGGGEEEASALQTPFDLIIGSDLAYRDELHDPLIAALQVFATPATVTLLGVTMIDTKPVFFHKLVQAGFRYEKLADHLLEPTFRGYNFGIFVIQRPDESVANE